MNHINTTETSKSLLVTKLLVLIIGLIGPFTANLYIPSLPAISSDFVVHHNIVQLTITIYLLGFGSFQLLYGPASDRFGRRKIALVGLSIALLGSIGCWFAKDIQALLWFRLLQGIGMAATVTLMRSIMRDIFSGVQLAKAMSQISIAFAIAPALAPLVGGYLQEYFNWRANFTLMIFAISMTLIAIFVWLPETNKNLNPNATKIKIALKNYHELLSSRIFMAYLACASFSLAGIIAYVTASPILFQQRLGMSPSEFGMLAIYIAGVVVVSRLVNSFVIEKVGIHNMLLFCMSLMFLGGISMLIIGVFGVMNVAVILIPTIIFIVGAGTLMPNAMANAFTPYGHIVGSCAALYGCIQILVAFCASAIIAMLPERNQINLACVLTCLAGFSFLIYYYSVVRQDKHKKILEEATI